MFRSVIIFLRPQRQKMGKTVLKFGFYWFHNLFSKSWLARVLTESHKKDLLRFMFCLGNCSINTQLRSILVRPQHRPFWWLERLQRAAEEQEQHKAWKTPSLHFTVMFPREHTTMQQRWPSDSPLKLTQNSTVFKAALSPCHRWGKWSSEKGSAFPKDTQQVILCSHLKVVKSDSIQNEVSIPTCRLADAIFSVPKKGHRLAGPSHQEGQSWRASSCSPNRWRPPRRLSVAHSPATGF